MGMPGYGAPVGYRYEVPWMSKKRKVGTETEEKPSDEKATVTLPGTVEKIIPPIASHLPEKAQISVEGGEHLYKEIRVENTLQDAEGKEVSLKPGATVDVTIAAEPEDTEPKKDKKAAKSPGHSG